MGSCERNGAPRDCGLPDVSDRVEHVGLGPGVEEMCGVFSCDG